jgi:hypothetical protein
LLSFDQEYHQDTLAAKIQEESDKGVSSSFMFGAKHLGMGVVHGIGGLITMPLKGYAQGGFVGFIKGLGKGIIGVAVKPTVGVLQFVSSTTAGIRNIGTMIYTIFDCNEVLHCMTCLLTAPPATQLGSAILVEVHHLRPPRQIFSKFSFTDYNYQVTRQFVNLCQHCG